MSRRRALAAALVTVLLVAAGLQPRRAEAAAGDAAAATDAVTVAVVAHPAAGADSLSRTQLLDLYTGDIQRWPDGTRVVLTDLQERGPVRDRFYDFLDRRPSRMKSIWLRRMLSGDGAPPLSLATQAEVLDRVAATPGAIGYVDGDRVPDGVRVLLVIPSAGATAP